MADQSILISAVLPASPMPFIIITMAIMMMIMMMMTKISNVGIVVMNESAKIISDRLQTTHVSISAKHIRLMRLRFDKIKMIILCKQHMGPHQRSMIAYQIDLNSILCFVKSNPHGSQIIVQNQKSRGPSGPGRT